MGESSEGEDIEVDGVEVEEREVLLRPGDKEGWSRPRPSSEEPQRPQPYTVPSLSKKSE